MVVSHFGNWCYIVFNICIACIPKCHWYGQHDGFDCIVIDLLGSSLKDLQETVRDIPLDILIDLGCQLVIAIGWSGRTLSH